jgi:hypothetical protein
MNDDVQTELLREAVRWLRFQSIDKAKAAVTQHLDTDEKKAAFEMADGLTSARSVAPKIGVSSPTIGNWWGAWFSAGILSEHNGAYKKLFSLSDLGIAVPAIAAKHNSGAPVAAQPSKGAKQ